jgi:hypothetical protein
MDPSCQAVSGVMPDWRPRHDPMADFSGRDGTMPKTARWAAPGPTLSDGLPRRVEAEIQRPAAVGDLPRRAEAEANAGGTSRHVEAELQPPQRATGDTGAPQSPVPAAS